jgi:hypothetical protein
MSDEVIEAEASVNDKPPQAVMQAQCAFIVYQDMATGHWVADSEHVNNPIQYARQATAEDFYHAACTIQRDVNSADTAQRTVMLQQQAAAQMAERMKTAQIVNEMAGQGTIDPKKLIHP